MIGYLKYLLLLTTIMACSSVSYDKWTGLPMNVVSGSKFSEYIIPKETITTLTNGKSATVNEYVKLTVTTHKGGENTVIYADEMLILTIVAKPAYKIRFTPSFDTSRVPAGTIRVVDQKVLTADIHALVTQYGFTSFFTPLGSLEFIDDAGRPSVPYTLVI